MKPNLQKKQKQLSTDHYSTNLQILRACDAGNNKHLSLVWESQQTLYPSTMQA